MNSRLLRHRVLRAASSFLACAFACVNAQQVSFPVSDLVRTGNREPATLWLGDGLAANEQYAARGRFLGESEFVGKNSAVEAPPPFKPSQLAAMVDAMTNSEGKISVRAGSLNAPADREAQVREALSTIRRMNEEVRYEVTLERVTGDTTTDILIRGTQSAPADRSAVLSDLVVASRLADFDVEIAQGAAISNPVIQEQYAGAAVAVRAYPMGSGSTAVIQAIARTSEAGPEGTIELGSVSTDKLDRIDVGIGEFAGTAVVSAGQPWVHEWLDDQGRRLRLTCAARWPQIERPWQSRFFWSGIFDSGVRDFGLSKQHVASQFDEAEASAAAQLAGILEHRPADLRYLAEHPAGLTLTSAPGAPEFLASVESDVDNLFETARIQIRILEADTGSVANPFDPLPQGVRVLADTRGTAINGLTTCTSGSRTRSFLRDWDTEVAQISRIADPRIGRVTTGYSLQSTVYRTDDARQKVRLLCDLQTLVRIESITALIAAQSMASSEAGMSVVLPRETVRLERPEHRASRIDLDAELGEDGTAVERRILRSFTGPGREIVVAIRVESQSGR